ncbi:MAG: M1 family metallopeptidase [Phycisphaerales bacterium]|nr:M1 family metallopeptidase [Phycisphaerales bacterium]
MLRQNLSTNLLFRATIALLISSIATITACSTTDTRSSRAGVVNADSVGAVDDNFRRTGGRDGNNIFKEIDLPTPTSARLGSGKPGPDYWQQRVDYSIDATLHPETDSVSASMTVVYHNNSPHELEYMWIQLEQNLFKLDSIGSQSRTPGSVMKMLEYDFDGGYNISNVRSAGQELTLKEHDTLAKLELTSTIKPGETFEFSLDFEFNVPPALRRMGKETVQDGKIFELAQWFPHVCKYDDVNGWNTLPYLGSGEFYTDFGSYDVSITVPRHYLVAGSGMLTNPEEVLTSEQRSRLAQADASDEPVWIVTKDEIGSDDIRPGSAESFTWNFKIDDARTFAWAASDAFMWDACKATITDLDGNEKNIRCQSLFPVEATVWGNDDPDGGSTRYVKHSIEFYSDWLYPYQYPVMSNINGPEGGMEYPGIMFCGSRTNPEGLFGVTDHEVGHNWFPMLVNSDERRYMWQDEGFNTFINIYSKAAWYGQSPDIKRHMDQTIEVCSAHNPQPIVTAPDRAWPRWVGRLMYRKTGYGLYILREFVLGKERFDDAFSQYIQWWAYKHPQPSDFFRTMEDSSGLDLDWFWRGWFLEPTSLDLAIAGVNKIDDSEQETYIVTIDSLGEMVMPVHMRIIYRDGTSEERTLPVEIWHVTTRWNAGIKTGGKEIDSITIDPHKLLPDVDRTNNRWER